MVQQLEKVKTSLYASDAIHLGTRAAVFHCRGYVVCHMPPEQVMSHYGIHTSFSCVFGNRQIVGEIIYFVVLPLGRTLAMFHIHLGMSYHSTLDVLRLKSGGTCDSLGGDWEWKIKRLSQWKVSKIRGSFHHYMRRTSLDKGSSLRYCDVYPFRQCHLSVDNYIIIQSLRRGHHWSSLLFVWEMTP